MTNCWWTIWSGLHALPSMTTERRQSSWVAAPLAAAAGVLRDRLTVRMVEPIAGGDAKDDRWLAAMAMNECPTAGVGAENTGHDVSHVICIEGA